MVNQVDSPFTQVAPDHLSVLEQILGAQAISTSQADIDLHARDQSQHEAHPAEVVIWPEDVQQVAAVLRYANEQGIAVTPWGVGTGLEGNAIPIYGGILLSLARMTRIIAVHADDFQVTVEAGLGHVDLNAKLARYGLFFPPDPGANATIGGMLANNAAGIRTVKYGASRDNVLKIQVVLADGRLIEAGSRSVKQASGYDLMHLFVGSEGTLGVITQATLKLVPVPPLKSAVVAAFPSVAAAVETVVEVRGSGLDPAALELLDGVQCGILREYSGVDLESKPTLFMEFEATHEATLTQGLDMVRDICNEAGATGFRATADNTERAKLWEARHHSYETLQRAHPGQDFYITDVAVPISAYPQLIATVERLLAENNTPAYLTGHAGDGNMHVTFPFGDDRAYDAARTINDAVVREAIALGGTATGEHGVGIGKRRFMREEHGDTLDVMRDIKRLLDPNGILNPGKVFPPD